MISIGSGKVFFSWHTSGQTLCNQHAIKRVFMMNRYVLQLHGIPGAKINHFKTTFFRNLDRVEIQL